MFNQSQILQAKVLPVWQPVGYSTHVIAKNISKLFGVKTSHTGTLDPMAQGVIVILLDDWVNKKYELANTLKTYKFTVVFGLASDTFDGLGLISSSSLPVNLNVSFINSTIFSLIGNYSQKVPAYSAIKVKGKPLHWYARNNQLQSISTFWPIKNGTIEALVCNDLYQQSFLQIKNTIIDSIKLTSGDLRQTQSVDSWNTLQIDPTHKLWLADFEVTMTKGLYVRQLSQDICSLLNTTGLVTSLTRTQNGDYTKNNTFTLNDIFKSQLGQFNFKSEF